MQTSGFYEQSIKKQVTIASGAEGFVSVAIPAYVKAFLKGYGYTWFSAQTYQLDTGQIRLPSRTDQEGSITQPVIYGNPLPLDSSGLLRLNIRNGDTVTHDYEVIFYIITSQILKDTSAGSGIYVSDSVDQGVNISATKTSAQNGTLQDVIQVPSGLKYLIEDVFIYHTWGAASGNGGYVIITDSSDNLIRVLWDSRVNDVVNGSFSALQYRFTKPFTLIDQQKIRLTNGSGGQIILVAVQGKIIN